MILTLGSDFKAAGDTHRRPVEGAGGHPESNSGQDCVRQVTNLGRLLTV